MLEFSEDFFDQEVRDGFYLDTTMKTFWAASLEVLQKIAEVCDRHHLTWYVAYGTLLGAIRHEGFIPWDDDIDIWLKRSDYMKLMKVLPAELPKGYCVRSALTEEGYTQFHSCVNNGNGINITPEWMNAFHNCPFTVGLDIFALDYLPRNKQEREMQINLFALTGHAAKLAQDIWEGKLRTAEDEGRTEKEKMAVAEMHEILDCLEKNCHFKINRRYIEEEDWEKAQSEIWKWGNRLAMIYGEKDGDYLVEYMDYVKWDYKKYPKAWFKETYGASFENFMVPVPSGYDEILTTIYKDYHAKVRCPGMHEYPFYARQLKQLREYVKNIETKAEQIGLLDEIEVKEATLEIPDAWQPLITKKDGARKKIVLSANNPQIYVLYGDEALDKLEETLHTFEKEQDVVTLWWRPHPVMRKILDQVNPESGERYQRILDGYKAAGWGICDETDNVDRAVEVCDAYYGDMNAILQPFQSTDKFILLNSLEEKREEQKNLA